MGDADFHSIVHSPSVIGYVRYSAGLESSEGYCGGRLNAVDFRIYYIIGIGFSENVLSFQKLHNEQRGCEYYDGKQSYFDFFSHGCTLLSQFYDECFRETVSDPGQGLEGFVP